ncbi:MAG: FHA domain-containing protein [Jaaginema sp. PMC 1079.18]|nr:FHA domain-containing protein [Jaaginema sp. PMC 1080.18]MEC4850072.1 FHA domain-containing protein [Jaaginema sp. PMC 1079.18]MEC4864625.1 FHA domain-containing protein [Jaaginema sp. PMC 1078.18]
MIVCPNCNHSNPDGANQCEACYTPLPQTTACPSCGNTVQADASFCGQCGFNLAQSSSEGDTSLPPDSEESSATSPPLPTINVHETESESSATPNPTPVPVNLAKPPQSSQPSTPPVAATQLQSPSALLLHVQTNTEIELPQHSPVIHIGKPGAAIPPDVDVSGFPDSSIVSRVHADIRLEEGIYYIEDVGSSNGTYVNHTPLVVGNRHRLRAGDRIALGKEDKVTFIFQMQ